MAAAHRRADCLRLPGCGIIRHLDPGLAVFGFLSVLFGSGRRRIFRRGIFFRRLRAGSGGLGRRLQIGCRLYGRFRVFRRDAFPLLGLQDLLRQAGKLPGYFNKS